MLRITIGRKWPSWVKWIKYNERRGLNRGGREEDKDKTKILTAKKMNCPVHRAHRAYTQVFFVLGINNTQCFVELRSLFPKISISSKTRKWWRKKRRKIAFEAKMRNKSDRANSWNTLSLCLIKRAIVFFEYFFSFSSFHFCSHYY